MKILIIVLTTFLLFSVSEVVVNAQSKEDASMTLNNGKVNIQKNLFTITSGNVSVSVNPEVGGRIISFKLNNHEILKQRDSTSNGYGSTFWPSPQSNWNWPPPAVLDTGRYSYKKVGNSIILTSGKGSTTGFQFIKEISPGKKSSINLDYSIINISKENKKVAPWEITRVNKGGLLFFPMGKTPLRKKLFELAPVKIINKIAWYKSTKEKLKNHLLTITDGSEGWLAYAIDHKLFIKKFPNIQPKDFAPGEAEVLFYVDAKTDLMEIEAQGKYQMLKPGEKLHWGTKWTAVEIPSTIKLEEGNMKLVNFVREIIKQF